MGVHLDRKLHMQHHVTQLRCRLRALYKKLEWLIGKKSMLSVDCKITIYKQLVAPIWRYALPIWGAMISDTQLRRIESTQNWILRKIVKASWWIRNQDIRETYDIGTVDEIFNITSKRFANSLVIHPNANARKLIASPYVPIRLERQRYNQQLQQHVRPLQQLLQQSQEQQQLPTLLRMEQEEDEANTLRRQQEQQQQARQQAPVRFSEMRINSLRRQYREGRMSLEDLKLAIRDQPLIIQQLVLPRELAIEIYRQQQQQQQQHPEEQEQQLEVHQQQQNQTPDVEIVLATALQHTEQQSERSLSQTQHAHLQQQRLTEDERQLEQRLEIISRQLERDIDEASNNEPSQQQRPPEQQQQKQLQHTITSTETNTTNNNTCNTDCATKTNSYIPQSILVPHSRTGSDTDASRHHSQQVATQQLHQQHPNSRQQQQREVVEALSSNNTQSPPRAAKRQRSGSVSYIEPKRRLPAAYENQQQRQLLTLLGKRHSTGAAQHNRWPPKRQRLVQQRQQQRLVCLRRTRPGIWQLQMPHRLGVWLLLSCFGLQTRLKVPQMLQQAPPTAHSESSTNGRHLQIARRRPWHSWQRLQRRWSDSGRQIHRKARPYNILLHATWNIE
ncbi:putative mediator of RNA polymerase II transcription subunit 26 [Drosophila montana]|uniref:putative mediator of RNA polymerase II transcription subunit 26 n=1 Tax=Drosophila montana TaxID=40370 RepID=UPI00313BD7BA